ncbi:MAG: hypothetical protein ABJZ55_07510 [Fuerstiella sp.]
MKNESFDPARYQRPHDGWQCGHHCDGRPCPIGPSSTGGCTVNQICAPVLQGDAWHCTRAKAFGGRCQEGPVPDPGAPTKFATCPHQPDSCQPQRSLRQKRGIVTGIVVAASLGICLVVVGGSSGRRDGVLDTSAIVSPGALTSHHASLEQGCATCHTAASQSAMQLLNCLVDHPGGDLADSRKCLECHREFGDHAMHAHSVPPKMMQQKSEDVANNLHTLQQQLTRLSETHQTTESGQLACASCHVEHHGVAFHLTALTNQQCQSCHSGSFHSFANGHPEFRERKRAFLYFDHSTHLQTHFKKASEALMQSQSLECRDCHVQSSDGSVMVLANYEKMCQECHHSQVMDDAMPMDLRIPGTEFVTFRSPKTRPAWMQIVLGSDVSESSEDLLFHELIDGGDAAVVERLKRAIPASDFDARKAASAAKRLEESGFFVALRSLVENARTDDEFAEDDLQASPSVTGAWSIHEDHSLRYRSSGHADPLIRDWLNFAVNAIRQYPEVPEADSAGAVDRLFQQLAAPEASGRCMKCHTVDRLPSGGFRINWETRQSASQPNGFTQFSHGPHVALLGSLEEASMMDAHPNRPTGTRCETCHAVQNQTVDFRKAEFLLDDWMPNPDYHHAEASGLTSVQRADCAKCHTPDLAGDSCLQCHNYHVHPEQVNER